MNPKPPRSVTVGGQRIRIQVHKDLEDWGDYDHDKKIIRISGKACSDVKHMLSTLRHEMVHVALRVSGVAFSDNFEEEAVVRCMDDVFFPAWDRLVKRLEPKSPTN